MLRASGSSPPSGPRGAASDADRGSRSGASVLHRDRLFFRARVRILIYDSVDYFVLEAPGAGGIEVVDKRSRRRAFLAGDLAVKFRSSIAELAPGKRGRQRTDRFLRRHHWLYRHATTLH